MELKLLIRTEWLVCRAETQQSREPSESVLRFNFKGTESLYVNLLPNDLHNMGLVTLAYEKVALPYNL